jgi:hypothetical protein
MYSVGERVLLYKHKVRWGVGKEIAGSWTKPHGQPDGPMKIELNVPDS